MFASSALEPEAINNCMTHERNTRTFAVAISRSEKLVSVIRLGIGFAGILWFTFRSVLRNTPLTTTMLQLGTMACVCCYAGYYLIWCSKQRRPGLSPYITTFLDVFAVTAILWSFSLESNVQYVHEALFTLYYVVIALTALHHNARLSLFGGGVAIIQFGILYFSLYFPAASGSNGWIYDLVVRLSVLPMVTFLSALISLNNYRGIQRVITSEIRYENLVQRLPEMLFTLDTHGKIMWASQASTTILGLTPAKAQNRAFSDFLVTRESFKIRDNGFRGTVEVRDSEGKRKYVDCILQPATDGTPRAKWQGLLSDVTDKELAISQREEMASRLFQYEKMESLGTMASGMAHDFNNILQTIGDIVSGVSLESKETETRRRMELVAETLADAKFLVSELLALSRNNPLDFCNINVSKFFEGILPLFREQLGPQYTIEVVSTRKPIWIQGDQDYLKRVFQNLIGNARDSMPDGGTITIESRIEQIQGIPDNCVIRISDHGTGISPELRERIFDPFFTTKKPGKGTGLGLALVRRIITLHKGQVFVEKSDSEGTTFRLELPCCDTECPDNDTKSVLLNRIIAPVLLLDDDPKIRGILKIFLKGFGYSVYEASTGEEGVALLKEHTENNTVVILDWKLGTEDPHRVIGNLREVMPELVLMVVSGYPPQQKSIESMKITKWFTKPYDKNLLDLEIQRALHRKTALTSTDSFVL